MARPRSIERGSASSKHYDHPLDSSNDHTGVIVVIGWYFFIVICLIIFLRFMGRKYWSKRPMKHDERAIYLSLLLYLGYQWTMTIAVLHGGLGLMNMDPGTQKDKRYNIEHVEKMLYAGNILSTLSITLSRLSTILLITEIFKTTRIQLYARQLHFPLFAWSIISLVLLLFPCAPPNPWASNSRVCMNRTAAYSSMSIIGLALDIILVFLPIYAVNRTPLPKTSRPLLRTIFCFRFGMCACVIAQNILLWAASANPRAFPLPFMYVWFVVATQGVCLSSILAACLPHLKWMIDGVGIGHFFSPAASDTRGAGRGSFRYAEYNEYVGLAGSAMLDCGGKRRDVDIDGNAMPLAMVFELEAAQADCRELRRRGHVGQNGDSSEAACGEDLELGSNVGFASIRTNSRFCHGSGRREECGRSAAQRERLHARQTRAVLNDSGAIPETLLASERCGTVTTNIQAEGTRFDFSEDPVHEGWECQDSTVPDGLPVKNAAENHGLCSWPGCAAGQEWPDLDEYPENRSLQIVVQVEIEVQYETAEGYHFPMESR